MDLVVSEPEAKRLLSFVGYGNPAGRFWFVGMEEAGALTTDELRVRADLFHPIDDLARVHTLADYWMDIGKLIPTWSAMARLALRLEGHPRWHDRDSIRAYQRERLGRISGDSFLTEILPLPSPSRAVWPYGSLFPDRKAYEAEVLPHRIRLLRGLFDEYRPDYVFCYGKANWPHHERLFAGAVFEELETGRVRVGALGQSRIILTHFFSRYFLTDARVDAIAASLGTPAL